MNRITTTAYRLLALITLLAALNCQAQFTPLAEHRALALKSKLQGAPASAAAQVTDSEVQPQRGLFGGLGQLARHGILNHLDIGLTAGTTGIGLELASPLTKWARVRAGYSFVPHFSVDVDFGISNYQAENKRDNFSRIQEIMFQLSGYDMDKDITMKCTTTMQNWKVLFDIFPIPDNKHWFLTLGLYGGSRQIGKTINQMHEMPSLLALGLYNRFYDMTQADDFLEKAFDEKFLGLFYLDLEAAEAIQNKFRGYGRLGIHIGDRPDGTPYIMEPDSKGTVSAKALVNTLRPYAGLGYEGGVSRDGRWRVGVEAGVMCWGGEARVITHDGTCLNDLSGLHGDVKKYMDLMKAFKVWPVVNLKVSCMIF